MFNDFLGFEADTPLSETAQLIDHLDPSFLVISRHAVEDDDEEKDQFFIVDSEALRSIDFAGDATIGEALQVDRLDPATVVNLPGWQNDIEPVADFSEVVFLQDGLVRGLAEPPRHERRRSARQPAPMSPAEEFPVSPGGDSPVDVLGAPDEQPTAMGVSIDYPKTVALNETASLLIGVTLDPGQPDVIPVAVTPGDVIDVVVSARSGFVVEGPAEVQLPTGDGALALPARIKARAVALGPGQITVYAILGQTTLGSLTITPEVVRPGAGTGPRVSAAASLETKTTGEADLLLLISEQRDAAGRSELVFRLKAPDPELKLNMKAFGPVRLERSPATFFSELYAEIDELPADTERLREIAAERLAAIGSTLFGSLLPQDLQALLWGLRQRIRTVFIQSEEPWVPWELCRLQGVEDGRVVEGEFFCEAFEVTRWILEIPLVPDIRLSDVAVIAPPSDLASAKSEVAMLLALAGPGRSVVEVKPATYTNVRSSLADGTHDGIHFVGHGRFAESGDPTRAEFSLAGSQTLKPTDITGKVSNLGIPKPLVFLNACEVGRQGLGLTGVGGWATALLRAGAGALVASLWTVSDELALAFSTAFYQRLLAGETVGAAMHAARLSIRDAGDSTWLAYVAFADPGARLPA